MGYTHYWRKIESDPRSETLAEYRYALSNAKEVVRKYRGPSLLCFEYDEPQREPETEDGIQFNGKESDGHETFLLPEELSDLSDFDFCKTAMKPYDVVVVAVLATMAHFAPSVLRVTSDGSPDEWVEGCSLAGRILGVEIPVPSTIFATGCCS